MAAEKRSYVAFTTSKDEFVRQIIAGLGPYPHYYTHMGKMNQAGPESINASLFAGVIGMIRKGMLQ